MEDNSGLELKDLTEIYNPIQLAFKIFDFS